MAVEDPEVDTFQMSTGITSGLDLFEEKERIKVDSSVWDLNNWVNNCPIFCDGKQQWRENQKFCFVPVRLCCLLDPQVEMSHTQLATQERWQLEIEM